VPTASSTRHDRFRPRLSGLLLATLVLPALSLLSRGGDGLPKRSSGRTVAVGDVHGDVERFTAVLREAGLVDASSAWTGGETQLVLTGDLLDRGPRARDVLDLVMRLESQAPGRVHPLLGNHEAMNLMGDLRYVSSKEYGVYADAGSEALRGARYESWLAFERERAGRLGFEAPVESEAARTAWMAAHPPGFFERRQAFGPSGAYGRWLRGLDAARMADGVLFAHGGPSAERLFPSVAALNDQVRRELSRFDELWSSLGKAGVVWPDLTRDQALPLVREEVDLWEAIDSLPAGQVDPAALKLRPADTTLGEMRELLGSPSWAVLDSVGPLWYRGLATLPDDSLAPRVERILAAYGASHLVVGHTPTSDSRVRERLAGRVFLIDTGLSAVMEGRPSALEIQDGRFTALYPGEGRTVLWPAPAASEASRDAVLAAGLPVFTVARSDTPPAAGDRVRFARATEGYDGLHGLEDGQIETFLRQAPVAELRKIGSGVTKPSRATLDDGHLRHDAAIQSVDVCEDIPAAGGGRETLCDSYKYNIAAYEIGKLLGLGAIPPSVERKFDGRKAAFTWWIDDAVTLADMKSHGLKQPDMADWNRQQWTVGIFDELIFNTDRNQGNLLVDPAWRIWMIDHTRAFHVGPELRNAALLDKMRADPDLLSRLGDLSAGDLDGCCRDYLTSDERKSVLARRDSILAHLR
jgi:hypothetical protein